MENNMAFGEFMWYALAVTLGIALIIVFGWMGIAVNVLAITTMVASSRAIVCKCKILGNIKQRFSLINCS